MRSVSFRFAPALLSASVMVLLSACSSPMQQTSTTSAVDTAVNERETRPMPAYNSNGQIRIPFGTSEPTEAELRAEQQRQSTTQGLIPEARTFLGSIPCETSACSIQRVSLTLLPDGRWRRIAQPLVPAAPAKTEVGCWQPEPGTPPRVHLFAANGTQATGLATFSMPSPAVLRVQSLGAKVITHRYTLNIQADTESNNALQNVRTFTCPVR